MSDEPGASLEAQLNALQDDLAFLHAVLDKILIHDEARARLSKEATARAGKIEEGLCELAARLPGKPGPRRKELDESLVQEIVQMHEERGWGRPRILAAMRDSGVTERQVRRVLAEHAGRIT